jgi:hypothetical protein
VPDNSLQGEAFGDKSLWPFFNPEGIGAFSPGLARFTEGLPWVRCVKKNNPEGVASPMLTKPIKPFQGIDPLPVLPSVAHSSQHWVDDSIPLGLVKAVKS